MRYPVYVISKGRAEQFRGPKNRPTARVLDELGVPYRLVVEPQEFEEYAEFVEPARILSLPFSNLGLGSIPARNWVWEHAVASGAKRHWIMDDNICHFRRLADNKKLEADARVFDAMEDFVDRYSNVAIAGPNKDGFVKADAKQYAYQLNARVYSCILIKNDIPYRWRGRYNEDTDLCLRALKDGWVTVLFHEYLMDKATTMRHSGGNCDELYAGLLPNAESKSDTVGRWKMAESLRRQHPDVAKVIRRFKRWHHLVDYSGFNQPLIRKPEVDGGNDRRKDNRTVGPESSVVYTIDCNRLQVGQTDLVPLT